MFVLGTYWFILLFVWQHELGSFFKEKNSLYKLRKSSSQELDLCLQYTIHTFMEKRVFTNQQASWLETGLLKNVFQKIKLQSSVV